MNWQRYCQTFYRSQYLVSGIYVDREELELLTELENDERHDTRKLEQARQRAIDAIQEGMIIS